MQVLILFWEILNEEDRAHGSLYHTRVVMENTLSLECSYAAYFETVYYTRQRILEIALLILFSRGLELK